MMVLHSRVKYLTLQCQMPFDIPLVIPLEPVNVQFKLSNYPWPLKLASYLNSSLSKWHNLNESKTEYQKSKTELKKKQKHSFSFNYRGYILANIDMMYFTLGTLLYTATL